MSKIIRLFMYASILAAPACGSKTTGTHTAGTEASEAEKSAWPHAILRREPEDSLKSCDSNSLSKKYAGGAERWFYRDTLMNGAYKTSYSEEGVPYYSVATYRNGIKNDTVRHYHAKEKWLSAEVVTRDSIHEICQMYYSNGYPKIRYEATRGRLDGERMRWFIDGKPDKLQHFKDGELHGEEKNWYPNGYLASVNSYAGGERVGTSKSWSYSRGADDAYYHLGATEAPDRSTIEYRLPSGYRILEIYEAGSDDRWLLARRQVSDRDKLLYTIEKYGCDSVTCDTVSSGKRLEVCDYLDGQLLALENYPLYSGDGVGIFTETYSDTGELIRKKRYDDESGELTPVRIYSQQGAVVTGISSSEYERLVALGCNVSLNRETSRWVQNAGSVTLRCREKEIELLGSSVDASDPDPYRQWSYEGYDARSGLHFIDFRDLPGWGSFAVDDSTGQETVYDGGSTLVFCGKSDLFVTVATDPEEGGCWVLIYKTVPGGRLARVAILDRGGRGFYESDLDHFTWVNESTLVAKKMEPGHHGERYYASDGERADEDEMPYVRIEVIPEAWQNAETLPLSNGRIGEMNDELEELRKGEG